MILTRLMMLATISFWGWSFVATKICLNYMTPLEVIGWRYLLGLPVLLVIVVLKGFKPRFSRHEGWILGVSALVITAHFLIQVTGMKYTSATNTGWLIAVTPVALAVLARCFLKERITRSAIVGIVLATAGVLLLVSRGELTNLGWLRSTGDWLVLGSAFTWATYTILTRNVSQRHPPLMVTFSVLALSSTVILVVMAVSSDWTRFLDLPIEPMLAILFLGIVSLALAFWFWQEGVTRLGAAKAGFFLYLEPLATMTLAVPYLKEPFGPYAALGGALLLMGVFLAQKKHSPSQDSHGPSRSRAAAG